MSDDRQPLLQVEGLRTDYVSAAGTRITSAVNNVSFSLDASRTLGIVGESGSGKSTLVLSLMRILPPAAQISAGRILFEGEDLLQKSDKQMRRIRGKDIAMILQDPMASLNPLFTVGEQISETLRNHLKLSKEAARKQSVELLDDVSIPAPEERVHDYPHQMSGGMRQRTVGAIGISCGPKLLIADEPTTSLDLTTQADYLNLLRRLQLEYRMAMIFVTHNLGLVAKMCDDVAVMYSGRLVEIGPVKDIFREPAHPYTAALLKSIPRFVRTDERLDAIEGQPPDPANPPPGCPFHPRCTHAMDICRQEMPPDVPVGAAGRTRCWLHGDGSGVSEAARGRGDKDPAPVQARQGRG